MQSTPSTRDDTLAMLRQKLKDMLPLATAKAIASYEDFTQQMHSHSLQDAKSFSAHHAACKAALLHLDTLTKLTKWVESQTPTAKIDASTTTAPHQRAGLETLIKQAREDLLALDEADDQSL